MGDCINRADQGKFCLARGPLYGDWSLMKLAGFEEKDVERMGT